MVEFSHKLKPVFIDNCKLFRLGSINDEKIESVKSYIKSWIKNWFKNPEIVKTLNLYG